NLRAAARLSLYLEWTWTLSVDRSLPTKSAGWGQNGHRNTETMTNLGGRVRRLEEKLEMRRKTGPRDMKDAAVLKNRQSEGGEPIFAGVWASVVGGARGD